MEKLWDCIVVGAGAAGLSAALVLGRARQRTLVVDAGGQSNRDVHGIGGLPSFARPRQIRRRAMKKPARDEHRCDEFPVRRESDFVISVASDPTMDWARAGALETGGR